jgi:hypothetical protein
LYLVIEVLTFHLKIKGVHAMSDAEVKNLNQVHSKGTYVLSTGVHIEFIHDHSEKTFDAWEVRKNGQKKLIETQPTILESFDEFRSRILAQYA